MTQFRQDFHTVTTRVDVVTTAGGNVEVDPVHDVFTAVKGLNRTIYGRVGSAGRNGIDPTAPELSRVADVVHGKLRATLSLVATLTAGLGAI